MLKMQIDPAMCMKTNGERQNVSLIYAPKCKIDADFAEICRFGGDNFSRFAPLQPLLTGRLTPFPLLLPH
jgi:hypothetical protein